MLLIYIIYIALFIVKIDQINLYNKTFSLITVFLFCIVTLTGLLV
jgi:hypothetical protein